MADLDDELYVARLEKRVEELENPREATTLTKERTERQLSNGVLHRFGGSAEKHLLLHPDGVTVMKTDVGQEIRYGVSLWEVDDAYSKAILHGRFGGPSRVTVPGEGLSEGFAMVSTHVTEPAGAKHHRLVPLRDMPLTTYTEELERLTGRESGIEPMRDDVWPPVLDGPTGPKMRQAALALRHMSLADAVDSCDRVDAALFYLHVCALDMEFAHAMADPIIADLIVTAMGVYPGPDRERDTEEWVYYKDLAQTLRRTWRSD